MSYESIEYRVEQGVAHVTLNRPSTLNSFTRGMHADLKAALEAPVPMMVFERCC